MEINNTTTTKNNEDFAKDVAAAIKWKPLLNSSETCVTAIDIVVTLTEDI